MSHSLKRRDFLKSVSLAGASIAMCPPDYANGMLPERDQEIENDYFFVSFDKQKGVFNILRKDKTPLLSNATIVINTKTGKRTVAPDQFKYTFQTTTFHDAQGSHKRMIVFARDARRQTDVDIHLSLFGNMQAVSIEAICRNVSKSDMVIKSLEPVRALQAESGNLNVPGVSKCITNGEMYFDTGSLHEFGIPGNSITSARIKGVELENQPFKGENETIHSWWNAGFFSGYDKEAVAIGYLTNSECLGNLLIARSGPGQISFLAESVYAPEGVLKPGEAITSNPVMINIDQNPYATLESYAHAVGNINRARTRSIINGWSSWFYTLAEVSEKEVVVNTAFAAEHLRGYGLEYIQVDEGYQKWHGDWEGNDRFPHGMKWLAEQIKDHGFKAGIWISPYVVSEPTAVVQNHPEWLVKNADGTPQRVGNWPEGTEPPPDENPKRYCLDITHPGAARWLHDLVDTIVNDWGYEMIKIDFVAWSILAAKRYHDPTLSSAQVYRKGMEIMRKAAGDKCHVLECGPGAITVGLIDSMRIELDVNYGFSEAAWNTYFLDPACSASAAGKRYYFHQRTWINDVDHVCMHLLNNQQSEAAATIIAMSGGNMMSGDRLTQLDTYKLSILKKISPSYGAAAVPADLFDGDMPSVFALKVKKPFGEWSIAAFFNASLAESIEKRFPLQRLWLDPEKTYLAFDFWRQTYMGELTKEVTVNIQPGSVTLLALHEKTGRPQLISTDRHVLQGAVEIEAIEWDEDTKTISGTSLGPRHTSHNVSVYVPGDHPWTWGGYVLFRDFGAYTLKLVHNNIIQVHVRFETSETVNWRIDVDEFFK